MRHWRLHDERSAQLYTQRAMFLLGADEARRTWVALLGEKPSDDDHEQLVAALERMADLSPVAGQPSVFILYLVPDTERPSAMWRQRFAVAERRGHGKQVLFALVTESAVLRGIRTAVSWLAPAPPGYQTTAVASCNAAVRWAERHRSGVASTLQALCSDVARRGRRREMCDFPPL